jgi:RsiW-degrading membrane proteinase PrsW (M82 family)
MRRAVWLVLMGAMCGCFLPAYLGGQESEVTREQVLSDTEVGATPLEAIWPRGEVREYLFQMAGQQVGRQWNQLLVGTETDSGQSYELRFKLNLDLSAIGQPTEMEMEGGLTLTQEGRPLSYELDVSVDEEKQGLKATFAGDQVLATVTKGGRESEHRMPFSPDIFVVDNNMIGQWGLMLGLLPLKVGQKMNQKIFIPQALSEMDIQVDVTGVEEVAVGGIQEEAFACHIAPLGEICWVTMDGRMVRLEDPKQSLVVTLLSVQGEAPPEPSSQDSFFLRTLPHRAAGYLIYLIAALASLALLGRKRLARWDLWVLLAAGGGLFPLALNLQVPLQRLYMRWMVVSGVQRGLSIFVLGIGTVVLSGIIQEFFKFLPVFLRLRFTATTVDHRTALALGAAVGAGFGLLEAILITGNALALGIISPWAIFERAFAILFHTAITSIMAWGICKRSSLQYFLLVAFLHSLGNYSVVLFHQHLLSLVALELSIAAFDLCILTYALVIARKERSGPLRERMIPQEVSHV